jgi:IclR family transcriptional regulator, acetate operon repressor
MRNIVSSDAKLTHQLETARKHPRSSDRVLQLLIAVAGSAKPINLSDAATLVDLVPSTALRQLRSLEASGLVTRNEQTQLYQAGPELIRLAGLVFVGHSLTALAQPHLDALALSIGESAYFAVSADGDQAIYIAAAPGHHALRHSGWMGRAFGAGSTAVGEALAGRVDTDQVVSRVGQLEPGITAIAATVHSSTGILGAINLVGPSFRLEGPALQVARLAVAAAAARFSNACAGPLAATSAPATMAK